MMFKNYTGTDIPRRGSAFSAFSAPLRGRLFLFALAVCFSGVLNGAAAEKGSGASLNLLICHQDQDRSKLHDADARDLPEAYVAKLAESNIVMVRYLLPNLIRKISWPEEGCEVVVIGTRVEVPAAHRSPRSPVKQQVDSGEMVLGAKIAAKAGLKKGDSARLRGHVFLVRDVYAGRGTMDDNTVWLALSDAQELLDVKARITLIQVLECNCAWADVETVKAEMKALLPDTQVVVFGE